MSIKARVMQKLYNARRVTADGLRKAIEDGVITEAEYTQIVGE